jgi:hypothetical protein
VEVGGHIAGIRLGRELGTALELLREPLLKTEGLPLLVLRLRPLACFGQLRKAAS